VHRLSGKHFWGGSLNYVIDYCKNVLKPDKAGESAVLISNDDLVLTDDMCISRGLDLLRLGTADIIAPIVLNLDESNTEVETICKSQTYDCKTNSYKESNDNVNVAVTVATWFSLNSLQHSQYIPTGMPHYGSDFWLTHQLHQKGFKILVAPNYTICRYAHTTSHSFANTRNWKYWKSCCNPKSPDYLPAAITFEQWFSKQSHLKMRLIILKLKFLIYRLLTRPKKNVALLEV